MKLSHRDFRPQRRSKYVSQPPKRRPTLRILLLAVFGILVYLKFDSIASLQVFTFLWQPKLLFAAKTEPANPSNQGLPLETANPVLIRWSYDSTSFEFACPKGKVSECLSTGALPDSNALGSLRALIHKSQINWALPEISAFSVNFQVKVDSISQPQVFRKIFQLVKLDLQTAQGTLPISARASDGEIKSGGSVKYCANNLCLDDDKASAPFPRYTIALRSEKHPFALSLRPLEMTPCYPILDGRIVEVQQEPPQVKVYHGKTIYSMYSGFSHLNANLVMGKFLRTTDTLGHLNPSADSLIALSLTIEKNGNYIDPIPFLALQENGGSTQVLSMDLESIKNDP